MEKIIAKKKENAFNNLCTIIISLSLSSSSSHLVLHSIIALFICVAKKKIDMKMQCMISLTKNF
jgi:hypothetical protein